MEDDKRGVNITLTNEGKSIFNDIEYRMNNKFEKIFKNIPSEQRENVLSSMKVLVEVLGKE